MTHPSLSRWAFLVSLCSILVPASVGVQGEAEGQTRTSGPTVAAATVGHTLTLDDLVVDVGVVPGEADVPAPGIAAADSFRVSIEGFEAWSPRPGAPLLPRRLYRIAIPFDAEVELDVTVGSSRELARGVPISRPEIRVGSDRGTLAESRSPLSENVRVELDRPDPAIYTGERAYPEAPVWLGRTGVFRDQRYVELYVAPVRFDPAERRLTLLEDLRIELRFIGGRLWPDAGSRSFDEGLYARHFDNHRQGRAFRRGAREQQVAQGATRQGGSGARYRLRIDADGLYRIDATTVAGSDLETTPMSRWKLEHRDDAIPLEIVDVDGDDLVDPGDYAQFYAEALTDDPFTRPNTGQLLEIADFGDERVFFLTASTEVQPSMPTRDAAAIFGGSSEFSFSTVAVAEVDDTYRPVGGDDPWGWLPTLSFQFNGPMRSEIVPLPGLDPAAINATFSIFLRGVSNEPAFDPDHGTRVTIRNSQGDVLATDEVFAEGFTNFSHVIPWFYPGSGPDLTDPVTVEIEILTGPWTKNDVLLDRIEVEYQRRYRTVDGLLEIEWIDGPESEFLMDVVDPAARIYELRQQPGAQTTTAIELTNVFTTASPPWRKRMVVVDDPDVANGTLRRFVVIEPTEIVALAASALEPAPDSDLRDTAKQADMIVIAHPDLLDLTPAGAVDGWLAHRASPAGGDLAIEIVWVDEIYDTFDAGQFGPDAIREFLRFVMSDDVGEGWADPKPRYLLFVGDASFDYHGNSTGGDRLAAGNYVPTQILISDFEELAYLATDTLLAAVVGEDVMPDLAVGRIPSRTAAETDRALDKVVAYETTAPTGSWQQHVLFLSDRDKGQPVGPSDFEVINQATSDSLSGTPFTRRHLRYWSDYWSQMPQGQAAQAMKDEIISTVNGDDGIADGAAIVQYLGHGNFFVWSDDFIWDDRPPNAAQDVLELDNSGPLSFLFAHNCLTGGFHSCLGPCDAGATSIAESWLFRDGGGAVGAFAPTGLSFNFISDRVINNGIWPALFGPTKAREIGSVALDGLLQICSDASLEGCQFYALVGDPATDLQLRTVAPPTDVSATAGSLEIELDWTASATPGARYDVYLDDTTAIGQAPQKFNGSPIVCDSPPSCSFTVTDLTNTHRYELALVAVDTEGFESRWSHLNTDCDVDGPDCLEATPLNPDPPSIPAGVAVDDPGIGDRLRISWAPNVETDLAYYTVHWGTTQGGPYPFSTQAPQATSIDLAGLIEGQIYYAVVTATNTSNKTSPPSAEVGDFPVFSPGLRAPRYIDDLTVRVEGADIRVEWGEVLTDVYGKPLTVATYEILRGTSADYSNDGLTLVDTCAAPCSGWSDVGVAATGESYHYRVRALAGTGLEGALGSERPRGTVVRAEPAVVNGPGFFRLTWVAVNDTIDGRPASGLQYELYASPTPFSRQEVRAGSVPLATTLDDPFIELPISDLAGYYSVIVVDPRGNRSPY